VGEPDQRISFAAAVRFVNEVLYLIDGLAGLPYLGEPVDQRSHALQCALPALAAGCADDLVVAAVLHDIARAPVVHHIYPGPHAGAGAEWCEGRFGPRVAALVGAHVEAKRWLLTTDPTYSAALSHASQHSLLQQGGQMSRAEVARFASQSWAEDAVALRRWDDAAKVPGGPEADPATLRPPLLRLAVATLSALHPESTS
jgi:predicted HD phosphohydrolase